MTKKIYIGVGHGGKDSGALCGNLTEKELNLKVSLLVQDRLDDYNVTIMMSRTKDVYMSVDERVKQCNDFNPDLAVDIHFNAGGDDGGEFYYSVVEQSHNLGFKLADYLDAVYKKHDYPSRGSRTRRNVVNGDDYYAFIRDTKCSAVICECDFIDNKQDPTRLYNQYVLELIADMIAESIISVLKLERVKKSVDFEPKKSSYKVQLGSFSDRNNAEKLVDELKKKGYDCFILASDN